MTDKTLRITLPGTLTGNLEFPAITQWGVGVDDEMVAYFDALSDAGTNMSTARVEAWLDWSDALKAAGIWGNLMEVYPLFGDNMASAQIPVLRRLSGPEAILLHPNGDATTAGRYVIENDQVVRVRGGQPVLAPMTVGMLYDKGAGFANQGSDRSGRTFLHGNFGGAGTFRSGVLGLRPDGTWNSLQRITASPWTVYTNLNSGGSAVERNLDVLTYQSISRTDAGNFRFGGNFDDPAHFDFSSQQSLEPTEYTKTLNYGLNATVVTTDDETSSIQNSAAEEAILWFSFDDGDMAEQSQQEAYHAAITALRAALY